ncbi:photosystem II repair protein Psb32 [Synechococcus sp. MIT S9503]|uniref:photosystem II repair protein Psb32 n=1 Tax=Synechococcus sp. MIT S9503 TaxID=3082547 RepID=UPI0039A59EEA
MKRLHHLIAGTLSAVFCLLLIVPAAVAVSAQDFPQSLPDETVLDSADVLSRASRNEISTRLQELDQFHVDARLVTLRRLDYGLSLNEFGEDLLDHWGHDSSRIDRPLLIFLEETQSKQATVVASEQLLEQLPESLLRSTGRTTMSQPLRDGDRFRQATLDGLTRLETVLNGGEDSGPPVQLERTTNPTNIPTAEETENSNAFTWVVVLLVVGTIVPMATWWIFSS